MSLLDLPTPSNAQLIINYLVGIADKEVARSDTLASTLGQSALTGIVMTPGASPLAIPAITLLPSPALPAFPTLPAGLSIDIGALRTQITADVASLQTSWMAKFLPDPSTFLAFDVLGTNVVGGASANAAQVKLDALETELIGSLGGTLTVLNNAITTAIASSKVALATNVAGLQPKLDAAIALANANTDAIAWARARDKSVREGIRAENEATSVLASRGFALPTGVLTALQQTQRQATISISSSVAGDEAVRTQSQYLELAKMSVSAWLQAADFQLKSEITAYTEQAKVQLQGAALDMENRRAKVKQAYDHMALELDFTKFSADFALRYRLGCAQAMDGLINAYANLNRSSIEYIAKISEAQRGVLIALVEYVRASLQSAEISMRPSIENNKNTLQYAQIAADFMVRSAGNFVQAAIASANSYSRVAGMALGGLNGVATDTHTS